MTVCACGGQTVKDRARDEGVELLWERCGSCGRCDFFRMKAARRVIARGQVARRSFNDSAVVDRIKHRLRRQA